MTTQRLSWWSIVFVSRAGLDKPSGTAPHNCARCYIPRDSAIGSHDTPVAYGYSCDNDNMGTDPDILTDNNRFVLASLESDRLIWVGKAVIGIRNKAIWRYKGIFADCNRMVGVQYAPAADENIVGDIDVALTRGIYCGRAFKLGIGID